MEIVHVSGASSMTGARRNYIAIVSCIDKCYAGTYAKEVNKNNLVSWMIRRKGSLNFMIWLFLLALLPVVVLVSQQRQDIEQGASEPATITVQNGQSIQNAINAAPVNAIIRIEDGVYKEPLLVKQSVTLQAINNGQVVLSGATLSPLSFTFDSTLGLYKADVVWPVTAILYKRHHLFDYKTVANLRNATFPSCPSCHLKTSGITGPSEGFVYDATQRKLFIRLQGGANVVDAQSSGQLLINGNNAGIGMEVVRDNVTIDGIRFELWHDTGIKINADRKNIVIQDNSFEGVLTGISATSGTTGQYNITVRNNEYSSKGVFDIRKTFGDAAWDALYDSNLTTRFVRANMNGLTITGNYIYDSFDSIEVKGWKTASPPDTSRQTEIANNFIQNIVDNPFEFDTGEYYMNARIHNNMVLDSYTHVSLAPFQMGKILVDHNIFYNSPDRGLNTSTWLKNCSHKGIDLAVTQKGMIIVHNTVVLGNDATHDSRIWTACDSADFSYINSRIQNNIIVTRTSRPWDLVKTASGFLFKPENLVFGNYLARNKVTPSVIFANPLLVSNVGKLTFSLSSGSPAIDEGVINNAYFQTVSGAKPDLGAVEYGTTWNLQSIGPSWGDSNTMPQRPTLPASISSALVGLSVVPTVTPTSIIPLPTTTPTPTSTPSPTPTITPSPTPTPTNTPTPTPIVFEVFFEAENGTLSAPFTELDGYIYQAMHTNDNPLAGGKAVYTFSTPFTGNYLIKAVVTAQTTSQNSFFINIDNEPLSPMMIWDIVPLTSGAEERTVSWRGAGTPDADQFNPKLFPLSAGTHQIILRGKEANTKIDKLRIVYVN